MSLADIKREMRSLSAKQRAELRTYSRLLDLKENPARQAELFRVLDRASAGDAVTEAEVRRRLGKRPKSAA